MTVTCPALFLVRWRKQSSGGDAFNSLTALLFGLFYWTQVGSTANETEKELFEEQVEIQVRFLSVPFPFILYLLTQTSSTLLISESPSNFTVVGIYRIEDQKHEYIPQLLGHSHSPSRKIIMQLSICSYPPYTQDNAARLGHAIFLELSMARSYLKVPSNIVTNTKDFCVPYQITW